MYNNNKKIYVDLRKEKKQKEKRKENEKEKN